MLQALTFYASRDKLATVGLESRLADLNRAAVRIARKVAGERCLVAGNISLTWMYEEGSPSSHDKVRATFDEQLAVQVDEGIDLVIGETFSWLGEALLAVERAKKTGLPVMVTISFEKEPRTAEGKSAAEAARALVDAGADVVGMNCLRSPELTLPFMEEMRRAVSRLHRLPARGLPNAAGVTRFHEPPPVPLRARSPPAEPQGNGELRPARARHRRRLHRGLLRRRPTTFVRWPARSVSCRRTSGPGRRAAPKAMSAYEYYGHRD